MMVRESGSGSATSSFSKCARAIASIAAAALKRGRWWLDGEAQNGRSCWWRLIIYSSERVWERSESVGDRRLLLLQKKKKEESYHIGKEKVVGTFSIEKKKGMWLQDVKDGLKGIQPPSLSYSLHSCVCVPSAVQVLRWNNTAAAASNGACPIVRDF